MTRLGILINPRSAVLSDRLAALATARGVEVRAIDLPSCVIDAVGVAHDRHGVIDVTHLAPGLLYGEDGGELAVQALFSRGVKMLNHPDAVAVANDKARTVLAFAAGAVAQPRSLVVSPEVVSEVAVLGFPVVLKRPHGALGMWNRLVESAAELDAAALELTVEGPTPLVAQEAITESTGESLRIIVLDGEVVAATLLTAEPGEWRSNGAQGSVGVDEELEPSEVALALRACAVIDLRYAGVDLVRSDRGSLCLEVNAASPFAGAERRSGVDIAGALLDALLLS